MAKIIAEIASNNIDSQGDVFSDECLKKMKDHINKNTIPITRNFNSQDVVGKVLTAKVKNGKLIVKGEIFTADKDKKPDIKGLYLSPGFAIIDQEKDGNIRKISFADTLTAGLITNPADKSLKQIEIDREEK